MRPRIVAAIAVTLALLVASCGARLTEEQRLAGIGALDRGGGTTTGGGGETATGGGSQTIGGTAGSAIGGTAGSGGGSNCRPEPVSGTGITDTQITVATVSDVTGVQPGLFRSTWEGMQAVAAYANSQGGVCGRQFKNLLLDDKTEATGNRAETRRACDQAFAMVGSMSAFDDGGARVVDDCGIPDMTAITVNPDRSFNQNTYAAYPNRVDKYVIGAGHSIKEKFPQAIDGAALLYLNAGVTAVSGKQRRKALEKIGFEFVYEAAVQIVETNYNSYVNAMKNHDPPVEYVTMVSDYQSIVRLTKAMNQQGWYPTVMDWDSVVYSPGFLTLHQGSADGSHFFINTAMFEERGSNPEMRLYEEWLARAVPGAKADYFGLYAWSAGRLFLKLMNEIGPKPTRKALFDKLKQVKSWDANGLHAAHNIAGKLPSGCYLYGTVQGTRFVRESPSSGHNCEHRLLNNPL